MRMDIVIDHKLRVAVSELPPAVFEYIKNELEIPNMERQKAMEQRVWGWQDLPETIRLWGFSERSAHVEMPRGFLADFATYLTVAHPQIDWRLVDQRQLWTHDIPWEPPIKLHPWQTKAVSTLLDRQQGIWKAPAGSGKTVGVLEAVRKHAGRAIVLVNTKDIMWQWVSRAKKFLGEDFPVSQIGDDQVEISQFLTIAMVQTLHRRYPYFASQGFFEYFSFMCLDECHHATAETFNKLVDSFSAEIRCGVSATPDKTGDFKLATMVLGPIIHETYHRDVDNLITPDVYKIPTKFGFRYRERNGRVPSNYPDLVQALIYDSNRNWLIIKSMMIEARQGMHGLVVSKRLAHLDILKTMLRMAEYNGQILTLTGKESSETRKWIVELAMQEPCVIFSTLADEALDIPRLDRIFLVFPHRNPGLILQQIGRIGRKCDGKTDAKILDFCDLHVGPLKNQWNTRRREVYNHLGYHIQTAEADHIMQYQIN